MNRPGTILTLASRRHAYLKIALLACAAAAAFLGAALVGVQSSSERKIGMFISLPWADAR